MDDPWFPNASMYLAESLGSLVADWDDAGLVICSAWAYCPCTGYPCAGYDCPEDDWGYDCWYAFGLYCWYPRSGWAYCCCVGGGRGTTLDSISLICGALYPALGPGPGASNGMVRAAVVCCCRFRRRIKNQASRPPMRRTAAPTAIPAMAPVERPPELDVLLPPPELTDGVGGAVGVVVVIGGVVVLAGRLVVVDTVLVEVEGLLHQALWKSFGAGPGLTRRDPLPSR